MAQAGFEEWLLAVNAPETSAETAAETAAVVGPPLSLQQSACLPYYVHTEQWVYVASHCDLHQIRSPTLVFYRISMVMLALSMMVVLLILLTMSVRIAWSHACYHILLCITHHL